MHTFIKFAEETDILLAFVIEYGFLFTKLNGFGLPYLLLPFREWQQK